MLDWLEWMSDGYRALRSVKITRRALEQVIAWLRRGLILGRSTLYASKEFSTDLSQLLRQFEERRNWKVVVRGLQPIAREKRNAAEAALHLCSEFGIEPTITRTGTFCRLAAVLYGDKRADLQKHCIAVLAPDYCTFLARI